MKPPTAPEDHLRRLERALDAETTRATGRGQRALDREILGLRLLDRIELAELDLVLARSAETEQALIELLDLPTDDRDGWVEARSWASDALGLGERLIEEANRMPLADRLALSRLAARVTMRTPVAPGDALSKARVDDVLGRAVLLEIRVLRRRGQLGEARERLVELEAMFATDPGVLYFWLTLAGERDLTLGLLLRDEGRWTPATTALHRAAKKFKIAGTEENDFEVLHAQVRTDLLRGDAARAVERLIPAPAYCDTFRRRETAFLRVRAALRTASPSLASQALVALLVELSASRSAHDLDAFRIAEAAVKLAEGQAPAALQTVAGPAERVRAAGFLLGSLRAALVECQAELARRQRSAAQKSLAAGVLERFCDLPDVPAIRTVLAAVAEHAAGPLDYAFLQRLDLWLILAEDSPGVGLPD